MAAKSKRILLAGATGYIGRAVASALDGRGHDLRVVVRDAQAAAPRHDPIVAEVTSSESLVAALADETFDVVISCIASRTGVPDDAWLVDFRGNCNLLTAARNAGAQHFLLLSAICVQRPRLAFQHAKLAFETTLAGSGMPYTIIRPTAFFKSLSGQVERVKQGKPFLVFGNGAETACKPIGEADLASFIADRIDDPSPPDAVLPVGGPGDAVTPRQQGELLFELTGRAPRFRRIPPSLFTFAHGLLAPLGRAWPAAARKAELARIGHYYATESMLVWDPRAGRYDAAATPSTGTQTLRDYYSRLLERGRSGQELREHKLF